MSLRFIGLADCARAALALHARRRSIDAGAGFVHARMRVYARRSGGRRLILYEAIYESTDFSQGISRRELHGKS